MLSSMTALLFAGAFALGAVVFATLRSDILTRVNLILYRK